MFHLRELKNRFKLKVSEYNKIVAWLNNVAEGWGMKIARPDNPSTGLPVVFAVDFDKLSSVFVTKTQPSASNPTPLDSGFVAGDHSNNMDNTEITFNGTGNGATVYVCTCVDQPGTNSNTFYFRKMVISPDGRIVKICKEE